MNGLGGVLSGPRRGRFVFSSTCDFFPKRNNYFCGLRSEILAGLRLQPVLHVCGNVDLKLDLVSHSSNPSMDHLGLADRYLLGPIASRTFLVHQFKMAPKQTDPQFKLRLTPEIKEAIEKAAAANERSMNAEIVHRLQSSLPKGEDHKFVIDLEKNLAKQLLATAALHDTPPDRLIAGIIEDHFRGKTDDFSYEIRDPDAVMYAHENLIFEIDRLSSELESDFLLYYQKLIQLKVFASLIIARKTDEIPKEIIEAAEELFEAAKIEQKVAKRRNVEFISSIRGEEL